MPVIINDVGTIYEIYNGVFTCLMSKDNLMIYSLQRDDSSVDLLDISHNYSDGVRKLFYKTETSDNVIQYPIWSGYRIWQTSYFELGSIGYIYGTLEINDNLGNHIELVVRYTFREYVDYIQVDARISSSNKIRYCSFLDSYALNFSNPVLFRSALETIDDFSSYSIDPDLRIAWNQYFADPNVNLYDYAILDDNGTSSKGMQLILPQYRTYAVWRNIGGADWRKDGGAGLTELHRAGLYFTTRLYRYRAGTIYRTFVPLRIIVEILEPHNGWSDGQWKEVGRLDYLARLCDYYSTDRSIWESHFMPWPDGIDISSVEGIRFIVDADEAYCNLILDDIRYLKYVSYDLTKTAKFYLGKPYPINNAYNQTGDAFIYAYNGPSMTPFDAVGLISRWDSAKAVGVGYNSDMMQGCIQIESVGINDIGLLNYDDEYNRTAHWEIWTHHSDTASGYWNFAATLQNRQIELAKYQKISE